MVRISAIIFTSFALGLSIAPTLALRDPNEHQTTELIPRGGVVSLPHSPDPRFRPVSPPVYVFHSIEPENNLQAKQRRYRTQQSFKRMQRLNAAYPGLANSRDDATQPFQQLPPSFGRQKYSTARTSAGGEDSNHASSSSGSLPGEEGAVGEGVVRTAA